jgi:hypothetical protein
LLHSVVILRRLGEKPRLDTPRGSCIACILSPQLYHQQRLNVQGCAIASALKQAGQRPSAAERLHLTESVPQAWSIDNIVGGTLAC